MFILYFSYLFLSHAQMPKQFRMNLDNGFFVINLLCTPSRTSQSESNLDGFMYISIKGKETFGLRYSRMDQVKFVEDIP